ncbi:MAG: strawberry notch C-terminal domain-containing protein, partial [Planctomycetota bacterium]
NLTNTKGDGTVSHEWGHALDYLFFRTESEGAKEVMREIATELRRKRDIVEFRKRVESGVSGSLVMRRSGKARSVENVRALAEYYMSGYGSELTQFKKDSNELGKDYWGSDVEMFARAFEAYIYDTMQKGQLANNYLVSDWVAPDTTTKENYRGTPYPQGEERAKFNAIFDAMVQALTVKDGVYSIDRAFFRKNLPEEVRDWEKLTKEIYDDIPNMVAAETARREEAKRLREEEQQQAEKDKWKAALEEAKAKQKLADEEKRAADEAKAEQAAADTGDVANTVDESKPLSETEAEELFEQALSELQEELEGDGKDPLREADTPEGEPTQGIPWTKDTIFEGADELATAEAQLAKLQADRALPFMEQRKVAMAAGYEKGDYQLWRQMSKTEVQELKSRIRKLQQGKPDDEPPKGKKGEGAKLAKAVKDSGVEGLGNIAKGLQELFPTNKLHSFPPTVDPDHYAKAKPYFSAALVKFQESGQNLLELVRWLIRTYGANIKPYILYFIKDEGLSLDLKTTTATPPQKPATGSLSDLMYQNMAQIKDNNDLKAILAKHHGRPATELEIKEGQEAFELALVVKAREIIADGREKGQSVLAIYNRLKAVYEAQPLLNSRTSTSMAQQAYSTPMPLAFLASELAGINAGSAVYEPTAGNGALLIGADNVRSTTNELNPGRAANLRSIGFLPHEEDATTWKPAELFDATIMNPPFGPHPNVKVDGYNLSKIDHVIAAQALSAMKDDGKATIIIGANKVGGQTDKPSRIFLNWLYANYDVVDHFEVRGDLYRRQGAGWPVKVITVHGRKLTNRVFDETIERLDNWESIYEHVNKVLDTTGLARAGTGSTVDTGETAVDTTGTQAEAGVLSEEAGAGTGAGTGQSVRGEDGVRDSAGTESVSGALDESGTGDTGTVSERPDDGSVQPAVGQAAETGRQRPSETEVVSGQPVAGAALRTQPNVTVGSEYQTAYMTGSSGFNEDVLIPVNMASAVEATLTRLNAAVGDSDAYLQQKLGYKSKKALHKAFMALQVDAVASAINTIETSGRGTIIADQTGVGKGRQAAAMIRYALRNDMVPVFVTVTPNLFTDMYDDLLDIDETGVKPYIFNDEGGFITDREGGPNKFRSTAKVRREGQAALKAGKMPTGANTLMLTYSQTNNYNAAQRDMLEGLKKSGKKVLYIFDEAHTIAGDRQKWNSKAKEMRKTRAGFFFELIEDQPVVYLSATYAKRPDNVPIYYRTDLIDAVEEVDELEAAVGAGGEGLQTVMANMLAKSGQLWRRERSFAGIEFKSVVFGRDENGEVLAEKDEERKKHIAITNEATKGLREIVAVDRLFGDWVAEEGHKLLDVLPGAEGGVLSAGGTNADLALQHSLFASVVHNFVSQLLLSLKADWIVEEALAQHKAGKKPVIALHNTMESFLEAEKERGNVEMDGEWDGDYRSVLTAALERTRRITLENKQGDKERIIVPLELLPAGIQARYEAAQNKIEELPIEEVVLFYIDYITNKLEQGGMNVGEITGRKFIMDYSEGGNPIMKSRPNKSKKFRRTIIDRFNSGKTDALIINAAGSTGLSIHASENFKDQKPRHMLVAQAIPDINTLMQMFGRINRTGQTALPEYSMLGLDLPSEKRPLAMTARKMRSLNANTSANTESETSIDASEILNKYGDLVVKRVMIENPEFQVYSSYEVNDDTDAAGLATKITGKLSLAPYDIQEKAWDLFLSEYQQYMEMLDSTGQNDLRVETQDLNAKIIDSKVIYEGKDPSTVFGGNTTLHKVSINLQGRAPSHLDVLSSIDDFLEGRTPQEVTKEILDYTKLADVPRVEAMTAATMEEMDEADRDDPVEVKAHQARIDKARQILENHNRDKRAFEQTLNRYPVGSAWKIDIGDDVVTGTIVSVKTTHKEGGGNPFAPSKIQYRFMVNSPVRLFPVAMSGINRGTVIVNQLYVNPSNMENLYNSRAKSSRRETRYIATGNLISGYSRIGGTGKVTSFTAANGKAYTGILLPRKFGEGGEFASSDSDPVIMRDPTESAAYLRGTRENWDLSRFGIFNLPDQDIRIRSAGNYGYGAGKWIIEAPKKRTAISHAIKFDPELLKLMGTEFAGRGQTLEATFDDSVLDEVLRRVSEITTLYIPGSGFSALSNITGRQRIEPNLSFDDGPADERLREDYSEADEGGLFE